MTPTMQLYWDASSAMIVRDWKTFISYRSQLIGQFVAVFSSLTLFYYVSRLVSLGDFGPKEYFGFVVIGMVILETLQSTLNVAMSLRSELVAGTFERILLSPFGPVAGLLSMMLFPFVHSLISGVAILLFGALIFGLDVHWSTAALAIPVAVFGTGAFAAFGMLFAASTVLFKRVIGGAGLLVTGISILSGLYFPIALLPEWAAAVAKVQPFTPAVDLLRHYLVGYPLLAPVWEQIAKMVVFVIIAGPLAVLVLKSALRAGQRRGTIIEY